MWKTMIQTPVGELQAFTNEMGLCGLVWPQINDARFQFNSESLEPADHPLFVQLTSQLREYFAGERQHFDLPLAPVGTEFQCAVWKALREIPFGQTRSYAQQAASIGRPKAVRAVGAANGRNPISIVVPCHRVIGSNGKLTGFAGGIDVKQFLLEHESRIIKLHLT